MDTTKEKQKSKVWFITGISRGFGRELASDARDGQQPGDSA
jgi:NAD(P)-dependent dehydrogenase (short-subunit alcohol dehydrogenase family)